jgi:hypothetical protein
MPRSEDRTLRDLIDCLGREGAFRLIDALGGQTRRIPKKPPRWLTNAIGKPDAQRLVNKYKDTHLGIPKAVSWKRAQRNRAIQADYDAGVSVHELVTKYDLTQAQIVNILNSPVENLDTYGFANTVPYFPNGDHRTIDMFGGVTAS